MGKDQWGDNSHKSTKKRRARWHNYSAPGTYMLSLAINDRLPLLGTLIIEPDPHIVLSPLGQTIADQEIDKINTVYPMVKVWKWCIMPDHIHLIVNVSEDMPKGKHLGTVIGAFKGGCTRARTALCAAGANAPATVADAANNDPASATVAQSSATDSDPTSATDSDPTSATDSDPASATVAQSSATDSDPASATVRRALARRKHKSDSTSLFEEGYNDRILLENGQLENWKHYLDDNPRRLAIKRQHPDYFTIVHNLDICGRKCQIVGNRFLLDIPDKMAVIVHRHDSLDTYHANVKEWMACGERGGVLVSAAIAEREKEVMHEAMERGYNVIWLRENGFPQYYKPGGRTFDTCAEGLLLQISPWEYHNDTRRICRAQCMALNDLATDIAAMHLPLRAH